MKKISEVSRLTDNPHLNLYHLKGTNRVGKPLNYYIASRVKNMERLKLKTKRNDPDGIIVYSLYGEKRDRVVLVRRTGIRSMIISMNFRQVWWKKEKATGRQESGS